MAAPFQTHLDKAMAPLLARTARRVARCKRLQAEPVTDATTKALAAEQAEIHLVATLAADLSRTLVQMQRVIVHNTAQCRRLGAQLAAALQTSAEWETRFYQALEVLPPLPDDKAPALALTGYAAMVRMQALRTDPTGYAAAFPLPYPHMALVPAPAHVD